MEVLEGKWEERRTLLAYPKLFYSSVERLEIYSAVHSHFLIHIYSNEDLEIHELLSTLNLVHDMLQAVHNSRWL